MPEPSIAPIQEPQVFAEPWHAQLFAITMRLSQAGHFSWTEWSERFGAVQSAQAEAGAPDDGSAYYDAWLAALESLLIETGLAGAGDLDWDCVNVRIIVYSSWGRHPLDNDIPLNYNHALCIVLGVDTL